MFVAFALGAVIAYFVYDFVRYVKKFPPGPFPLPVLGNILSLDPNAPHESIAKYAKTYGPVFTVWIPQPNIVITDYELIKEALIKEGDNYAGRFRGNIFTLVSKGNYGMVLSEGNEWKEQRRFALHVLRNFGFGRSLMEDKIMSSTTRLTDEITQIINDSPSKMAVTDLSWPMQEAIGNIINSMLLGYYFEKDDPRFIELTKMIAQNFENVRKPALLLVEGYFWLRHIPFTGHMGLDALMENVHRVCKFMTNEIETHKKELEDSDEPTDFVNAYLQEMARRKAAGEDMGHFSDWQLLLTMLDIWVAGMETTVTTMKWALLFMVHYPEVQRKVQAELDNVVGRDRHVTMADKSSLPYTNATIVELQRCANIIPFNVQHKVFEETTLNGLVIPAGATIIPQVHTVHEDPKLFPNPKKFDPERFLDKAHEKVINTDHVIPFSLGKRACLGESLARMELFLIFSTLLQKFEFSTSEGRPLPSLKPKFGITLTPEPYEVQVTMR
uniref:Cytochrome P450 n=1 Tax=Plectus sambesii TaxID=2011161 RepID=A0A914XEW4_9BILA